MRYVILGVIALLLAFGVMSLLKGPDEPAQQVDDGDFVLIAKVDLQPGTFIIGQQHVDWADIPDSDKKPTQLQKGTTTSANFEGAVVRSLIKAGEPVNKEKIVTPREGGFLSAVLYPGMRAISVAVDVVSANAGFIFPGDRVDLLLTHEVNTPDGTPSYGTETFVEDVRVLAVDQLVNNPNNQAMVPKTVTLEVTPKQAESVLVATQLGKISLVLRSLAGTTFNNVNSVSPDAQGKTYTKDSDVSRIIHEIRPGDSAITVTRGKEKSVITGGGESSAPAP